MPVAGAAQILQKKKLGELMKQVPADSEVFSPGQELEPSYRLNVHVMVTGRSVQEPNLS